MKELVELDPDDLDPVVSRLDPSGWLNAWPDVDPDEVPPTSSGLFGLFSARGPVVPLCTWHPGERSAGIQHAAGPKVAQRVEVPAGWRVVQDHPRRGLVVRVPPEVPDLEVVRWLVGAGARLCPVPRRDRWIAELHSP
jgi:hypothetical protein